jgi:hypothetical protein
LELLARIWEFDITRGSDKIIMMAGEGRLAEGDGTHTSIAAPSHDLKEDQSEISSEKRNDANLSSRDHEAVDNPTDETIVYPTGTKVVLILVALCLSVFLVALDQTIISTAIPKITDEFSSIGDIGWYGSSYLLTTTALQPTFGRIYTIFSVSPLFIP